MSEPETRGGEGQAVPGPSVKRLLARNTSANALAQAIQVGSSLVLMPFLLGSFGLGTYGVYLFASSLGGYLTFLDLGVGVSLTKFLAEYRAKHDDGHSARLVSSALAFYSIVGIVSSVVLVLIARFVVGVFHFAPAEQELARQLLFVAAVFSPFMWPIVSVTSVQAGLNRYDVNAAASVIAAVLNVATTIVVVAFRLGPVALSVGISLSTLVASLWNWRRAIASLGSKVRIRLSNVHMSALGPLVKMSMYVFMVQVGGTLIYQQTDRLIVGYFVGAAAVTMYEAAAKIESLVRQIAGMMGSAVVPAASHLSAQESKDALRTLLIRGTRYTAFVVLPIAAGLMLLARPLLEHWLGPALAASAVPAQLFLSYWLFNVNAIVLGPMIVGMGRLDKVIWWINLGTVLNVGLGVLLTWKFGLVGVILGTVLSHLLVLPPYVRIGYRLLDVRFAEWMRRVALPSYLPLLVTVAVVLGGYALKTTTTLLGVAVTGLSSVFAYWLFVAVALLDESERSDLRTFLRAVRGRIRTIVGSE